MEKTMYQTLMGLPLFAGVTYARLSEVISKAKFHFLKFPAGEPIAQPGEPCTHVMLILSGQVQMCETNRDGRFKLSFTLRGPEVVAPQFMFGKNPTYPYLVTATEPTAVLKISKTDYINILRSDEVFLYNYLNIISMSSQKAVDGILSITQGSIEERIAYWVITLTPPNARDITLDCKMRVLYTIYGVQRTSFINALDRLASLGLLTYTSERVTFTDRSALLRLLSTPTN